MRVSGSTRPIILGLILAIGITLTLPISLLVRLTLSAASGDSGLLGYTGNMRFRALFNRFGWFGVIAAEEER